MTESEEADETEINRIIGERRRNHEPGIPIEEVIRETLARPPMKAHSDGPPLLDHYDEIMESFGRWEPSSGPGKGS